MAVFEHGFAEVRAVRVEDIAVKAPAVLIPPATHNDDVIADRKNFPGEIARVPTGLSGNLGSVDAVHAAIEGHFQTEPEVNRDIHGVAVVNVIDYCGERTEYLSQL
jgi:hypothetical protein